MPNGSAVTSTGRALASGLRTSRGKMSSGRHEPSPSDIRRHESPANTRYGGGKRQMTPVQAVHNPEVTGSNPAPAVLSVPRPSVLGIGRTHQVTDHERHEPGRVAAGFSRRPTPRPRPPADRTATRPRLASSRMGAALGPEQLDHHLRHRVGDQREATEPRIGIDEACDRQPRLNPVQITEHRAAGRRAPIAARGSADHCASSIETLVGTLPKGPAGRPRR